MRTGTIWLLISAGILLCLNSLHAEGGRWGTDILVYSGPISCFDVDYKMDGTIYLGLQKDEAPNYNVCFYTSTDHGYTWNLQYETPSLGRISKMKILVGEPVHNYLYFFFVSPADNHPYVWRIASDFSGSGQGFLIDNQIADPAGFDAARSIADTYFIFFIYYSLSDTSYYIYRSQDYGATWQYRNSGSQAVWASQDLSITWGPPSNCYIARISAAPFEPPDSAEISVSVSENNATGYWWGTGVTQNMRRDYDPHLAASHDPANPAVWLINTYLYGGTDANLCAWSIDSLYYGSPGDWFLTMISQTTASEYWGDIKSYKGSGNPYVNMAWMYDDGGSNRNVHWTWSSGDSPHAWHDDIVINDYQAHPWPYGAAPRIVYSPGASVGGGGVVYAGFGSQNLYFDAPWVTAVEESTSPVLSNFTMHPHILTTNSPVNFSLSKEGFVEISLYNTIGRIVYHLRPVFWNEGSHSLHLSQLSNGIYFCELKLDGSLSGTAKLILLR